MKINIRLIYCVVFLFAAANTHSLTLKEFNSKNISWGSTAVRSTSKLCHREQSPSFKKVKLKSDKNMTPELMDSIVDTASAIKTFGNLYQNLEICIASGGKLTNKAKVDISKDLDSDSSKAIIDSLVERYESGVSDTLSQLISNEDVSEVLAEGGRCYGSKDDHIDRLLSLKVVNGSSFDSYASYLACKENGNLIAEDTFKKLPESERNAISMQEDITKFAGFNFGVGIGRVGFKDRVIEEVDISGDTLSIVSDFETKPIILLETHYYFDSFQIFGRTAGAGPFLSVGLSDAQTNLLSELGFGAMIGFKYNNSEDAFNIGFGRFYDFDARTLRAGFSNGMDITDMNITSENDVLRKSTAKGWVLVFSSTF